MPKIGREVATPDGTGPVSDLNIVKETVFVRLTNGDTSEIKEYPLEVISGIQENHSHQDTGRKNPAKETRSETNTEDDREKTADDNESDYSDKNSSSVEPCDSNEEIRMPKPKENNRNKNNKKAVLGKPVRRENPNRTDILPASSESETKKEKQQSEGAAVSPAAPKSNWADALEKAIQAIEQDK